MPINRRMLDIERYMLETDYISLRHSLESETLRTLIKYCSLYNVDLKFLHLNRSANVVEVKIIRTGVLY